jgi:regulator of sigma E protease
MQSFLSGLNNLVIFALVLGVLIIIHESGHFIAARLFKVRVVVFSIGFGPVIFKKSFKELDFRICLIPLGGYVKMSGFEQGEYQGLEYEYLSKSPGVRAGIVSSGPIVNYLFGWLLFCLVFLGGIQVATSEIGQVLADYPAAESGMQAGDIVTSIEEEPVDTWQEMTQIIQGTDKEVIQIKVKRQQQEVTFLVNPRQEKVKTLLGEQKTLAFIGVRPSDKTIRLRFNLWESFDMATKRTWELTALTFKGLYAAATNRVSVREVVGGPIAIYHFTAQASKIGLSAVVGLTAYLSLCLAIFNLLPLPVLDGGHILFLGLEKIRRRRLSPKTEEIIAKIGFTLILIIALLVLWNDLLRVGPEFIRNYFSK